MPVLYGCTFDVIVMASIVRPWNPASKATTAWRPVARRAILTAFSTASAPELKNAARVGPLRGARSPSRSASSTYTP